MLATDTFAAPAVDGGLHGAGATGFTTPWVSAAVPATPALTVVPTMVPAATARTREDPEPENVVVEHHGFSVVMPFGPKALSRPTEAARHKSERLLFTGEEGKRVFARLVDVLDEMATIVVQNGYTADAAWTLLRHNLDKEARELTRLMSGWSNGVGALLQRYARDTAQVDQQVYIATELRQKPEETAFSFITRLYKLCKPFPAVYSEEKMLKLFHERLRNEWCARNAVLVTRLTRATSVAEVKSLLTEHSEVMSSHGGGGAANDGGRDQRHRQGGGGQNSRGGQGASGGVSGGKGGGGPRNQGGSGASHDGGQAKSPKKGDKQGAKQGGKQGGKPTSKRCFNCNEAGHFANDCPHPRNHGDRGGGGSRVNTVGLPCKVNIVLTTTGAMEVVAELDSGTRYHLMSEATASQLGLMMESGSADMPPEGLKGANGSPIRVVGSARVPLVWGGTVETFVFYICEELVYPLVGYLALKGRND
jgi:hypothetical protein